MQVSLRQLIAPTSMLVNRATRTSSTPSPPKLATPLDRETSPKRAPSVPLLPVVLLICCGLAASRLLPTSSSGPLLGPSWIAEDILPRPSPVELSLAEQTSGLSLGASLQSDVQVLLPAEVQCQSWCVSRAGATASLLNRPPKMDTCLSQCLAHPEVMTFLPVLEASGALPSPTGRSLIFAAWYAEGERGAEVGRPPLLLPAGTHIYCFFTRGGTCFVLPCVELTCIFLCRKPLEQTFSASAQKKPGLCHSVPLVCKCQSIFNTDHCIHHPACHPA